MIELINSNILTAQLLAIPKNIRVAVETKAMKEIGKIAVDALRANNTANETGALKYSFKSDVVKNKDADVIIGRTGVDSKLVWNVSRNKQGKKTIKQSKDKTGPKNTRRRPAKYWHFLELGTKNKIQPANLIEKVQQIIATRAQEIIANAVTEALNK